MTTYPPEKLIRVLRELYREKHRLNNEAAGLMAQQAEVERRACEGELADGKARAFKYRIQERLELIFDELLPMIERRAKVLAQEYVVSVNSGAAVPGIAIGNREVKADA